MNEPAIPTTPRSRYNFRKSTKQLADKITSFFGVRKRYSEIQNQSSTKRRRSYSPNSKCFSSPVSVAPSPDRTPNDTYGLRQHSPLRSFSVHQEPSEFGVFSDLPTDVIQLLMNSIRYSDLGSLSMTSKSWKAEVQKYLHSASFEKRWVHDIALCEEDSSQHFTRDDPFFDSGTFLRKITSLEDNWDCRIKFLRPFLRIAHSVMGINAASGCGRLINAFVKQNPTLSAENYESVIKICLSSFGDLKRSLENVLSFEDDDYRSPMSIFFSLPVMKQELVVRDAIKNLFLNNVDSSPMSEPNRYFLSSIFQMYKPQCCTLLYLLYSPLVKVHNEEVIHWHSLAELVINTQEEAKSVLKPVATALRALLVSKKTKKDYVWSKNAVFNLMEEVTTYPSPWSMNTFVSLQLTEPCLIPISVAARVQKNYSEEASDMICTMKTLLFRWDIDAKTFLSDVFDALRASMSPESRVKLFNSVLEYYVKNLYEIQQREEPFNELRTEYMSQIALLPLLEKFRSS